MTAFRQTYSQLHHTG